MVGQRTEQHPDQEPLHKAAAPGDNGDLCRHGTATCADPCADSQAADREPEDVRTPARCDEAEDGRRPPEPSPKQPAAPASARARTRVGLTRLKNRRNTTSASGSPAQRLANAASASCDSANERYVASVSSRPYQRTHAAPASLASARRASRDRLAQPRATGCHAPAAMSATQPKFAAKDFEVRAVVRPEAVFVQPFLL